MKNVSCKHCGTGFLAVRSGHFYCSDTCRKLAHKAKKRKANQTKTSRKIVEKLRKLSSSPYGRYLVAELKRAGTVQVLTGHTHLSLQDLADLRRRCTADGGYQDGKAEWAYEMSHIKPLVGEHEMGLLHPNNLVVATKEFNRKLRNKPPCVEGRGVAVDRAELLKKWEVNESLSGNQVLKLARRFIGAEFDLWLKSYVPLANQKTKLLNKLKKAGIDPKAVINKSFSELVDIDRAIVEEDVDASYWTLTRLPKDNYLSVLEEINRFELRGEITKALLMVEAEDHSVFYPRGWNWEFKGGDYTNYVETLVEQAELMLHGQPFNETWEGSGFMSWWKQKPRHHEMVYSIDDGDEILF